MMQLSTRHAWAMMTRLTAFTVSVESSTSATGLFASMEHKVGSRETRLRSASRGHGLCDDGGFVKTLRATPTQLSKVSSGPG